MLGFMLISPASWDVGAESRSSWSLRVPVWWCGGRGPCLELQNPMLRGCHQAFPPHPHPLSSPPPWGITMCIISVLAERPYSSPSG